MTEAANRVHHAELATVRESAHHPDLDLVLVDWQRIASIAWLGFAMHGRGAVIAQVDSLMIHYAYHPGAPCGCFAQALTAYDPKLQVVIGVLRGGQKAIYVIDGWPTPPQAFSMAEAQSLG